MIKTNYHTHNSFCDGQGTIAQYIESAIEKDLTALGFSSHAPLPVENDWALNEITLPQYLVEVDTQKTRLAGRIQIYKGLEIDYIPGYQTPADAKWKALNLDYIVGSVHLTEGLDKNPNLYNVDGPVDELQWLIDNVHNGDAKILCAAYYQRVKELSRKGGFSFLAHFDLIKKHNRNETYFSESESWYRKLVMEALDSIADHDIFMEINSGAISRKVLDQVYPSPWILPEACKRNIPMVINADAHRPQDVDCHYQESAELLRDAGYREVWALLDGKWKATPLD